MHRKEDFDANGNDCWCRETWNGHHSNHSGFHCVDVKAVIDLKAEAPGILWAKERGIQTASDWRPFIEQRVDIIIEVTGNQEVYREIRQASGKESVLIPTSVAYMLIKLFNDKEKLISKIQKETYKYNLIFNSIDDGMVVINNDENVILLNKSAERMIGIEMEDALGKRISTNIIPNGMLPRVLRTRTIESNQEVILENGSKSN